MNTARQQFSFSSRFISRLFLLFHASLWMFIGRGTLTFDEFCRVAVHFSEEDDEALQLSTSSEDDFSLSPKMICDVRRYQLCSFFPTGKSWRKRSDFMTKKVSCNISSKALRYYNKDKPFGLLFFFFSGHGYIPTSSLREILAALDEQLTGDQLNGDLLKISKLSFLIFFPFFSQKWLPKSTLTLQEQLILMVS